MKALTKAELDATHRIFLHVNDLVGGYYGPKFREETKRYASRNRWIMFPVYNADSLREGTQLPVPNVYVAFDDEIKDDDTGRADSWVGVTYGNKDSMLWARELLKRQKKAQSFINMINGMGDEWEVVAYHKIHTQYWGSTPYYDKSGNPIQADLATAADIQASIDGADNSLLRPGSFNDDGDEVISCVTTLSVEGGATTDSFDNDIQDAFNLFTKLLSLR